MNPTTVGLLAPFLDYAIELEYEGHTTGNKYRAIMESLNARYDSVGTSASNMTAPPICFMPVLYSFDDLSRPLPDGRVPLIELAAFLTSLSPNEPIRHRFSTAEITAHTQGYLTVEWDCVELDNDGLEGEQYSCRVRVDTNWLISEDTEEGPEPAPLEAYDFLRSLHFAVGLQPEQYIRKSTMSS